MHAMSFFCALNIHVGAYTVVALQLSHTHHKPEFKIKRLILQSCQYINVSLIKLKAYLFLRFYPYCF